MMFWGHPMGSVDWVLMVAFWLVFVSVITWAMMRLLPRVGRKPGRATPEEILAHRLASGYIDAHAYRRARGALSTPGTSGAGDSWRLEDARRLIQNSAARTF